ncbi:hypothetical protein Aperf_G00000001331 [Anoplocephala perfoliata]
MSLMDIRSSAEAKDLVFHLDGNQNKTAWHIANTASTRVKNLVAKLSTDALFETALLSEIREVLTNPEYVFECNVLLSSVRTNDPLLSDEVYDSVNEEDQSDVLVLFGSPASLFQMFLSVPSLQKPLLDLIFEIVAKESSFSAQLLAQLVRPVGIKSFFTNFASVDEAANRLIELIGIIKDHQIKSHILQTLPELIASPVDDSKADSNSTAVGGIIQRIIDLLDGVFMSTNDDPTNHILFAEIIECVNHFPLEASSLNRLKCACRDAVAHSTGSLSNQRWISYLHRGYSKGVSSDNFHILDDFIILLLAYDSELSLECKSDPNGLSKRKELSLILKTSIFVAERLTRSEACELFSKSTPIFQQKELYCPLLTLTTHLLRTNQSISVHRFACLVYFSVFELGSSGQCQAEWVIRDLCKSIRYFYTAEHSIFTKKRTLQSARACLNILLHLSIKYTENLSPYFDSLVGLLDEITKRMEGILPDLEDIRKLFLALVNTAFGRYGVTYVQDDLLIRIRRLLLDSSNKVKAYGLVGAVVLLEIYCKREKRQQNSRPPSSTPISQAEVVESSVLSRQMLSQVSQITAASENTLSSRSNSHLSLKGPGTSLADDSQEVNLPLDSAELDSVTSARETFTKPPSRLLLQLVGLIENAIRRGALLSTQLKAFWLDELASMFVRLELEYRNSESSRLEAKKFTEWMGNRVMREFQEEFIVDNPPNSDGNGSAQLGLNGAEICEIALNVGPTLVRVSNAAVRPPLSTVTLDRLAIRHASKPLFHLSPASPALIPSQLRLIAVVESFKSNRSLDAINALLGCPFILPTVALADLSPPHLLVVTNCCIESVNTFAEGILIPSSKTSSTASTRRHPLASTFTCRLVQIASLRFCLHAVLLQRIKNAALTAAKMEHPTPIYEVLDTTTFDPTFMRALPGRQACVKRLLLFSPSTGKKVATSKCGQKRKPRRAKGGRAAKRLCSKSLFGEGDGEEDENALEDDDVGGGDVVEPTSMDIEAIGVAEQTISANKLAGSNEGGKANILINDPLLTCLTVCYRALGLPSILLGLQGVLQPPEEYNWTDESILTANSLPEAVKAIYDISGVKHFGREKSPDPPLNWITVAYLLNELKLKVDHLCGVDLKSSAGWYLFERFDVMSSQLRNAYLLAIVPCLVKVVNKLTSHFKDIRKEECDNTLPEIFNLSLHPSVRLLADCLSTALYCLVGFTMGFLPSVNSIRSPDILLSKIASFQTDVTCLTRLRRLAVCLDDPDRHARLPNEAREFPPVCLLEEDVLGITTTNSQSGTEDEKPDADYILRVIQWLVESSPYGLPHSPCAFIHACFVLSLARYLHNSIPAEMSAVYEHQNLASYTNALLNMEWDKTAVWQGNSHKDCLSVLLALQLHCPFFGPSINPLTDCLEMLINLSKLHLRPLLKRGGSHPRDVFDDNDDESEDGGEETRIVYRGLNTQSYIVCEKLPIVDQAFGSSSKLEVDTASAKPNITMMLMFGIMTVPAPQAMRQNRKSSKIKGRQCSSLELRALKLRLAEFQREDVDVIEVSNPTKESGGWEVIFLNTALNHYEAVIHRHLSPDRLLAELQRTSTFGTVGGKASPATSMDTKETATSGSARREVLLSRWSASLKVLICIIEASKGDSPSRAFMDLLPYLMRAGKVFLEHLLRGAMPFLNSLFRTHGSEVLAFIRNAQHITRFLQRICVHAKTRQEARLTPLIPQTRKCLETFVYSVKLLLSQNHCAEAFWLGNLKNRDLDGREIHDTDTDDVGVSAHNSEEIVASHSCALNNDECSNDGAAASVSEADLVEDTSDDEGDSLEGDDEEDIEVDINEEFL